MKKPLRLGFTDTNNQIATFFLNVLSSKFAVTVDQNNPQVVIFGDSNFGHNNLNIDKNKVVKVFYTGENQRPWNYDAHCFISFDHIEDETHYRLPLYVIYDWHNKVKGWPNMSQSHIRSPEDVNSKTKFCSFLVRNPSCQMRNNMFHKLSEYKKVDSGGPLFNNIGHVLEYGDNAPKAKMEWLKDYKFNICYENSSYPGYATEKLYEAYMGGTIPIYWGSPTIEVDFNPLAFLNRHNFASDEDFIKAIELVDSNDSVYNQIYQQPLFHSSIGNRFTNLDRFTRWFDTNVYTRIMIQ